MNVISSILNPPDVTSVLTSIAVVSCIVPGSMKNTTHVQDSVIKSHSTGYASGACKSLSEACISVHERLSDSYCTGHKTVAPEFTSHPIIYSVGALKLAI